MLIPILSGISIHSLIWPRHRPTNDHISITIKVYARLVITRKPCDGTCQVRWFPRVQRHGKHSLTHPGSRPSGSKIYTHKYYLLTHPSIIATTTITTTNSHFYGCFLGHPMLDRFHSVCFLRF